MQEFRLTILHLLTGILVIALFICGCGGNDDRASARDEPVTKAEFIGQADLICRKADALQPRALDTYRSKYEKDLEGMAPVRYEETVVRDLTLPSVEKEIRELESLKVPDGEERRAHAIIAGWKAALGRGEKNPYSVARWDRPSKDPFTGINRIAIHYGFNDCRDLR